MRTRAITGLGPDEIKHFENLARRFANRSLSPVLQGELPDGDFSRLEGVIETAFDIGIAGSLDHSLSGAELGVWGRAVDEHGLLPSTVLLSAIAESCGGVAMAIAAQGVACNLLLHAGYRPEPEAKHVALCLQEGFTLPYLGALLSPERDEPARVATEAVSESNGYIIKGEKSFVYSLPEPQLYVVLARSGEKWSCFAVPSDAAGLELIDPGPRTGLRACELRHVRFREVRVPANARVDAGDALPLVLRALCLSWVGMSAIAAGIARGALASARVYCSERYQGGTLIENHPAVKSLLATAAASTTAAESAVEHLAEAEPGSMEALLGAAELKLAATELCSRAVTEALQTFGGYGYMEDYGMEKRLRDAAVLKSAMGSPLYLRQLVFDIGTRGGA